MQINAEQPPVTENTYATLVTTYSPMVLARCSRELCPADADDATQAVFLVLWRSTSAPADGPKLAAWLQGVSRNVIRNAKRDAARRTQAQHRAKGSGVMHGNVIDNEIDSEIKAALGLEMDKLPRREREAVELYYLAGYTYEEIAQSLNGKTSTIAARVQRGLERLRSCLKKRGVTLSLAGLTGILSGEAATIPDSALIQQIVCNSPSAEHVAVTAADIPVHILRWSHEGNKIMTYTGIAFAAGLLAVSAIVFAQDKDIEDAGISLEQEMTLEEGNILCDQAVIIRLNDPQRSWDRFKQSPYAAFLSTDLIKQGNGVAEHLGSSWVAFDPMSQMSERMRHVFERSQVATAKNVGRFTNIELEEWLLEQNKTTTINTFELAGASFELEREDVFSSKKCFFDGRGEIVLSDSRLVSDLMASVASFLPPNESSGGGSLYSCTGGHGSSFRAEERGGAIMIQSDSGVQDLDLRWFENPSRALYPEADLEIYLQSHPRDQEAYADWSGRDAEVNQIGWVALSVTPRGISLEGRTVKPDGPLGKRQHDLMSIAPSLTIDSYERVPADALCVLAYALNPDFIDSFTTRILSSLRKSDRVLRELTGLVHKCILSANGPLLLYLQPGLMIPSVTVELPCNEKQAKEFLSVMITATEASEIGGDLLSLQMNMLSIQVAYRDNRLIFTSDLGGVEAVLEAQRGFTKQVDVLPALSALEADSICHFLVRHKQLANQVLPLLEMIQPELGLKAKAFAEALPEENASWLRWGNDADGFNASGDGAMVLLALPAALSYITAQGIPAGVN